MKLAGLLFLILGGTLLILYVLYHLVVFLISGSPLLLKGGVLFVVLGFLLLLISAIIDKKRDRSEVEKI